MEKSFSSLNIQRSEKSFSSLNIRCKGQKLRHIIVQELGYLIKWKKKNEDKIYNIKRKIKF